MRTLIFHELFECIARGLRTPFSGKSLPLRTPNCVAIEVRRAFSGALRRPHCADPQQQACMALNYRYQHCAGTWALRNPQWASTLLQPSRIACLERCCSRATSSSRFSRGMARTYLSIAYPEFITLINFCDCAQLRTGSHRNNFPLAHPIAHPDFNCSKIFIARLHCS